MLSFTKPVVAEEIAATVVRLSYIVSAIFEITSPVTTCKKITKVFIKHVLRILVVPKELKLYMRGSRQELKLAVFGSSVLGGVDKLSSKTQNYRELHQSSYSQ